MIALFSLSLLWSNLLLLRVFVGRLVARRRAAQVYRSYGRLWKDYRRQPPARPLPR